MTKLHNSTAIFHIFAIYFSQKKWYTESAEGKREVFLPSFRRTIRERTADYGGVKTMKISVSGKQMTPAGATEIMELLGKEESLARIRKGIELLENA